MSAPCRARRAALAAVAALCTLAACGRPAPAPAPVTRLGPLDSRLCVEEALARANVQAVPGPALGGWRLRLRVYSHPPAGWIDKGDIVYDRGALVYLPNGATEGLHDVQVQRAVAPALRDCL
jgi:hypothetical protein